MKATSRIATTFSRSGIGRNLRRAVATRDASRRADGSGAPSRARRRTLAIALAAFSFLLLVPAAFAAKETFFYIGLLQTNEDFGRGPFASEFNRPSGVAVNSTGVGAPAGTVYVADENNNRIQRFSPTGKFESAWGKDVTASTVNERQFVIVNGTAGTYTLSFNGSTTAPLPYNAGPFEVDNALDVLPSIDGDPNVKVDPFNALSPPKYYVSFPGKFAGTNQPQLTADTSQLSGTIEIKTVADGTSSTSSTGTGYEVCTIAPECKAGVESGEKGALNHPQSIAIDGDTGNVYVTDQGNHRVDAYSSSGTFLFAVGRDVKEPDGGTTVEICEAADTCRQGDGGSGPGELGSTETAGTLGIAVSPPDGNAATGKVFVADSQNRRVVTYNLDGTSPSSFGSSAQFGPSMPRKIAVDPRGIVYASDSNDGGRLVRYDTENKDGGGIGFLSPIIATLSEQQTIHFSGFSFGNKYTLTCPNGEETEPLSYSSSFFHADDITAALSKKCGAGSFITKGEGNDFTVEFTGVFAGANQPTIICKRLTGGGSCAVSEEINGHGGVLVESHTPNGSTVNSTLGLAVDPPNEALYVLRDPTGETTTPIIEQLGPVNAPGLTVAPTATDEIHAQNAGFDGVTGLGIDYVKNRLFVPAENTTTEGINRVYVLADTATIPPPTLTFSPVTVKTDTTATFSATVNPSGGLVSCKFEYSTDQTNWTVAAAPGCASFDVGAGIQAVSRAQTGLVPNTHYFVRLAVSRPFIPNSTITSPVRAFDTNSVPPVVSDLGAYPITDTSARMIGTIDPRNSETGYVFEYGTTPSLGSSTSPVSIGGGTSLKTVSQVVPGLTPDTTYYYRLVATNAFGSTPTAQRTLHTRSEPPPPADPGNCPNQAVRVEQESTYLPDCRAYEMVTPSDKNQGGASGRGAFAGEEVLASISQDGQSVAFCTASLFGEPPSQLMFACAPYISKRGADRWTTVNPMPPTCLYDAESGLAFRRTGFVSAQSFDRIAVDMTEYPACAASPLVPGVPLPSTNIYRGDITTNPFEYKLLTPDSPPPGTFSHIAGGSADFSHVVYVTYANQTPDSPPAGNFYKIYDWVEDGHSGCAQPEGCVSLVSVKPNGEPFKAAEGNSKAPGYGIDGGAAPLPTFVSEDGERIYFNNDAGGENFAARECEEPTCDLYLREGDTTTFKVSASECHVNCGSEAYPDNFLWATPTGDKALFTSCAKLTEASTNSGNCGPYSVPTGMNLYRWDRNGLPGHRLVDLSVDHEPGDGIQPEVMGVIGASTEDLPSGNAAAGNTVYFVAQGQIVSGEPAPNFEGAHPAGDLKLYRWQWNDGNPSVDYLGPYVHQYDDGSGQGSNSLNEDPNVDQLHIRVTPNGQYLVLQTVLRLDPAVDRDTDSDMYRWDEKDGWICISCQLPGAPSAGQVSSSSPHLTYNAEFAEFGGDVPEHTISNDGQRIFFSTPDALVPQDVNGEAGCPGAPPSAGAFAALLYSCEDVYEWHDGTVSLISSGTGSRPSQFIGASADGKNVYIATGQRLVGWDVDTGVDIYDVRVDGGYPEPVPDPPTCEGEACREEGTHAPNVSGAGTAVFEGPPNQTKSLDCKPGFQRRGGKCVKVKHHHKRHHRTAGHHRGTSR